MLAESLLRDHPEVVVAGLRRRRQGPAADALVAEWSALDARRRSGDVEADATARMAAILARLPNLPDAAVPDGDANVEIRRWGEPPPFAGQPLAHDVLAERLGILDLRRARELAGPRFPLLLGEGARLQRALAAFFLDLHRAAGYVEVAPPHLLREDVLRGTGHLPHFAGDLYTLSGDGLALTPTGEVPLVALHAGETLAADALPLAYAAWTPCFRREAGSAGAATRGLLRQHQFDKVELVRVVAATDAEAGLLALLAQAEACVRALGMPYRVMEIRAAELPFAAARSFDVEVWMPGQGRYVEVSSVSDCGTYQARGLALRVRRRASRGTTYPHTLNGSALALGRTLAALLELGQRPDGSIVLPDALAPSFGAARLVAR